MVNFRDLPGRGLADFALIITSLQVPRRSRSPVPTFLAPTETGVLDHPIFSLKVKTL
jgi:hypothetical protein